MAGKGKKGGGAGSTNGRRTKAVAGRRPAPSPKKKPKTVADLKQPDSVKANTKLAREERGRGRPTLCTPDVTEKVCQAIRGTGAYLETAALFAGISKSTLHNWLKWGNEGLRLIEADVDEDGNPCGDPGKLRPYVDFLGAVEKAIAEADMVDLARVRRSPNWQAAAWRMERRHPGEWGRRRVEVTGAEGGPVQTASRIEIEVVESRALSKEEFLEGVRNGRGGSQDGGGSPGVE